MKPSASNRFWLGIDLAKESCEASLAPVSETMPPWRKLPVRPFETSEAGVRGLIAWVEAQLPREAGLGGVCVESTGGLSRRFAGRLAAAAPLWPAAAIINPKRSLDFARSLGLRDKSDRIDAAALALYGAVFQPPAAAELTPVQRRLRELLRLRGALVELRDAQQNRLREAADPLARKMLQRLQRQLQKDIECLAQEARRLIGEDEPTLRDYRLLLSVKGIGPLIAWTLLAEIGDLRRFTRNELAAYAGLYPRLEQSGKCCWKRPGLAKGGKAVVRKALYNGARALLRSKANTLRAYADRLQERGERPIYCITATMRKMLLVARAVVVSQKPYDPEFESCNKGLI